MCISGFRALRGIRSRQLLDVFGVSRATVDRARKRYIEDRETSFLASSRDRGMSPLTPDRADRANQCFCEELRGRALATRRGVSPASVCNWTSKSLIGPWKDVVKVSDRTARDQCLRPPIAERYWSR